MVQIGAILFLILWCNVQKCVFVCEYCLSGCGDNGSTTLDTMVLQAVKIKDFLHSKVLYGC